VMATTFDITQDGKMEPNELNNLYVMTFMSDRRISYFTATSIIGYLCCYQVFPPAFVKQSQACIGLEKSWWSSQTAINLLGGANSGELQNTRLTSQRYNRLGFPDKAQTYVDLGWVTSNRHSDDTLEIMAYMFKYEQ